MGDSEGDADDLNAHFSLVPTRHGCSDAINNNKRQVGTDVVREESHLDISMLGLVLKQRWLPSTVVHDTVFCTLQEAEQH